MIDIVYYTNYPTIYEISDSDYNNIKEEITKTYNFILQDMENK